MSWKTYRRPNRNRPPRCRGHAAKIARKRWNQAWLGEALLEAGAPMTMNDLRRVREFADRLRRK